MTKKTGKMGFQIYHFDIARNGERHARFKQKRISEAQEKN
jgi:hypothetical protein